MAVLARVALLLLLLLLLLLFCPPGHALHLECAEMTVAAADARHVRCPLCREPVSLGGAVGARLFT